MGNRNRDPEEFWFERFFGVIMVIGTLVGLGFVALAGWLILEVIHLIGRLG